MQAGIYTTDNKYQFNFFFCFRGTILKSSPRISSISKVILFPKSFTKYLACFPYGLVQKRNCDRQQKTPT
ncbi:hypothetical protein [Calothrix sp. 336/3]|uniref:hypothetical protein n=1 Tax=Calothrix sp. 336/3 TaxID=1337936 RepID=UPI0004E3CEFC|nr:hypothetical protein [Calothrix sp. 336/3]AKG23905.1 hypothetical protein IJ00_23680 [Calothrix sp. 336/3]